MESVSVTVSLDSETSAFLDELARGEERDSSYLIRQAIANYVELRKWQIEEIRKAIKEADAGLFLSDEEAAEFMEELAK
jgi:RHH-type rel operon transcriptional repressor/antitoxin RelB